MAQSFDPQPTTGAERDKLALVVEGALTEQRLLAALAEKHGFHVVQAFDADSAMAAMQGHVPDLILLDIYAPGMDGLALLSRIRQEHPDVPVVAVTATDDSSHIDAALSMGAVNFLRKPIRAAEFHLVLDRISRALDEEKDLRGALASVVERQTRIGVPSDPTLLPRVVAFLGREIRGNYPGHRVPVAEIKLALFEALANAVEHGNLEIGFQGKASAMRETDGLRRLVRSRLGQPPYAGRRIHIEVTYRPAQVEYAVRDEGPGFAARDYDALGSLRDTTSLNGRGLALIRHNMDEVAWSDKGNEIRMVRYLSVERSAPDPEVTPE